MNKRKLLNLLRRNERWPLPRFDSYDQPHFLFIVTPPYSGSTALSALLNSSHRTMVLHKKGEGQFLVPGLCERDRWDPNKVVNYDSVKAVWLRTYQKVRELTQNTEVVIEKSPPNMMRIEDLSAQFRDCSFIANNRNPYACCASILYRHYDADSLASDRRKAILEEMARHWLIRANKIRDLVLRLSIPLLTYESFCEDPASVVGKLNLPPGVAETIDPNVTVKVKDYGAQGISNQNERQISKLTADERTFLGHSLRGERDLLGFFGYEIME